MVAVLLVLHAAWLAWSATWQSPTLNEPGHLASGIAHWTLGRFEPYAVNPPLVRMVAALPLLSVGCETDWSEFRGRPGERPEFPLGSAFIEANGGRSQRLFVLARWACIPFSLLGGWMCFVWGRALYGPTAGLLACALWCIEPNIIAHGQLITPDVAATSLGLLAMWTFWQWMLRPGWGMAVVAGGALGLALLAKLSWVVLMGLWPVIWLFVWLSTPAAQKQPGCLKRGAQLAAMMVAAIYFVNLCYGFDGSFSRLDSFQFISAKFTGHEKPGELGNRFAGNWTGRLPVPLPRQFVLGADLQNKDFERFPHASYLRGEWKHGGWWYYYLYAASVKVPVGLWLIGLTAIVVWFTRGGGRGWTKRSAGSPGLATPNSPHGERVSRDDLGVSTTTSGRGLGNVWHWHSQWHPTLVGEIVLFVPAIALFITVSSQTAFNHHFRYVLPCFGPGFILASGVVVRATRWLRVWVVANVVWVATSSALASPFSLSYFNELAGGMRNGSAHLLHSSVDWGQDLVALDAWMAEHREARPVYLAYYGFYDPLAYGVPAEAPPQGPFWGPRPKDWTFRPGWYAVSVNYLRGTAWRMQNTHAYEPLLSETPAVWCGGSIVVYRVDDALARKLTEDVMRRRD